MTGRVLVTGATGGIGGAIALALARDGFDIALHYRNNRARAETLSEQIMQLGRTAWVLNFDVTNRAQTRACIDEDMRVHGAYYGLICNAGTYRDNAFPAMRDEEWDDVIRTNLDGFYNVVQPCIMPMVRARQGGRIVVMSSASGLMGNRGQVNYSAAKAGLNGAVKALAVELAKREICVNCVAPGLIETEMTDQISDDLVRDIVPARRMGRPEEVASLISYLFSDLAGYITRQVISVNGGMF